MPLESGVPGISPAHMLLIFLMILGIPMIPYAFLYALLREKKVQAPSVAKASWTHKMMAWLHEHRHPQLLHH